MLGMLSLVLKLADTWTRKLVYNTLVRHILEFRRQVWEPYLSMDVKQLEKVQHQALRLILCSRVV